MEGGDTTEGTDDSAVWVWALLARDALDLDLDSRGHLKSMVRQIVRDEPGLWTYVLIRRAYETAVTRESAQRPARARRTTQQVRQVATYRSIRLPAIPRDSASPTNRRVSMDIKRLQQCLRDFAHERDWEQFHSPKNLAMALSVEVAELVEHFQWLTEAQSFSPDALNRQDVATEVADIQIYLIMLADKLGINIERAVEEKIAANAVKHPA